MEVSFTEEEIRLDRELTSLDSFVIDFTAALNKLGLKYVVISGYVAILFGRNRSSEDIDIFVQKLDTPAFDDVWNTLIRRFDCVNAASAQDAYKSLADGIAVRFSRRDNVIPNMEVKFPKGSLDQWTLDNRRKVVLNKHIIHISPIELQIAFKLSLGSEKDIEDARYLYKLFEEHIDKKMLSDFGRKLNISHLMKEYL